MRGCSRKETVLAGAIKLHPSAPGAGCCDRACPRPRKESRSEIDTTIGKLREEGGRRAVPSPAPRRCSRRRRAREDQRHEQPAPARQRSSSRRRSLTSGARASRRHDRRRVARRTGGSELGPRRRRRRDMITKLHAADGLEKASGSTRPDRALAPRAPSPSCSTAALSAQKPGLQAALRQSRRSSPPSRRCARAARRAEPTSWSARRRSRSGASDVGSSRRGTKFPRRGRRDPRSASAASSSASSSPRSVGARRYRRARRSARRARWISSLAQVTRRRAAHRAAGEGPAFDRVETTDRVELVAQVGGLVDHLESNLRSVLPRPSFSASRSRPSSGPGIFEKLGRGAPRATTRDIATPTCGQRASRSLIRRRSSLPDQPREAAGRERPTIRARAFSRSSRRCPDALRAEVITLDVARIDRAVTLLESWWKALQKSAAGDPDKALARAREE